MRKLLVFHLFLFYTRSCCLLTYYGFFCIVYKNDNNSRLKENIVSMCEQWRVDFWFLISSIYNRDSHFNCDTLVELQHNIQFFRIIDDAITVNKLQKIARLSINEKYFFCHQLRQEGNVKRNRISRIWQQIKYHF